MLNMKPRTKETLRYLGASLINNDACIAGARERPWYFAVPMAILSVLLALVPIAVTYFQQSGSLIVTGDTHGLDTALIGFQEALYDDGVEMVVNEREDGKHYLVTNFAEVYAQTTGDPRFDLQRVYEDGTKATVFRAYYYGDITTSELSEKRNNVLNGISPNAGEEGDTPYNVTTMFMSSTEFYITVAPNYNGQGASGSSIYGDYQGIAVGTDLGKMAVTDIKGNALAVTYPDRGTDWDGYHAASIESWKTFFDVTHYNSAMNTAWIQTGTAAAVFVAMCFFMGLMVFLMTRGKNNPFRIYTFWDSQKISYWASFTPGLLTLILGFLVPGYALLIYVACHGMRIVWLTMKSLRPAPAN